MAVNNPFAGPYNISPGSDPGSEQAVNQGAAAASGDIKSAFQFLFGGGAVKFTNDTFVTVSIVIVILIALLALLLPDNTSDIVVNTVKDAAIAAA